MHLVKSRREEYSEATRQALIESATALFADKGYARSSLDEIAAAARVTKGALYHHFDSKQVLMEAVLGRLETNATELIGAAVSSTADPWKGAIAGIDAYLDLCCDPLHSRVVMREGMAALGFSRWRELETEYFYALIEDSLRDLIDAGVVAPLPIDATTWLACGMCSFAALAIADAPDAGKRQVADEMRIVIIRFFEGLRAR